MRTLISFLLRPLRPASTLISTTTHFVVFCSAIFIGGLGDSATSLRVTVDATTVTVSGVSPGASVVLFSCSRSPHGRSIAVKPAAIILSDDHYDGTIRYTPVGGVALRSVWVAVEQSSGNFAAGAQSEFPLLLASIASANLNKDAEGELASIAVDRPALSVLLVRPNTGAWVITGFDGDGRDRDVQKNGLVELAFEDTVAVGGKDKGPKHLKKGDTVVAIDPAHLDVFATTIDK